MALLELDRVSVAYGAVRAVDEVSLEVEQGEVLGLCGDNGAGKSSLIKVIAGARRPSAGRISFAGRERRLDRPIEALEAGIVTIYQDLALAPRLAVWHNVFLGSELTRRSWLLGLRTLDRKSMRLETRSLLERLGVAIADVDAEVQSLSGGQRQAVAIARALRWQAKLLIMDEPTAALGVRETEEVLALIRGLKHRGVTVIIISHDMRDVIDVADRVAILKKGRLAEHRPVQGLDAERLAQLVLTARAA